LLMSMERDAILSLFSRSDKPTVFAANHMTKTLVLRPAKNTFKETILWNKRLKQTWELMLPMRTAAMVACGQIIFLFFR